jgi:Arc/MetJ family transcription regulator
MPSPIQIDDELYARVAAAAAHEGKDASTYVAELVREALRRRFAAVLSADTEDLEPRGCAAFHQVRSRSSRCGESMT